MAHITPATAFAFINKIGDGLISTKNLHRNFEFTQCLYLFSCFNIDLCLNVSGHGSKISALFTGKIYITFLILFSFNNKTNCSNFGVLVLTHYFGLHYVILSILFL